MLDKIKFFVTRLLKQYLKATGWVIKSVESYEAILRSNRALRAELLLLKCRTSIEDSEKKVLTTNSKAQISQDIFALIMNDFAHDGYFVEFGATDGEYLSNTWLLEKHYNWDGILAEPARHWRERLLQNRSCNISNLCVWRQSGEKLRFSEPRAAELAQLSDVGASDMHHKARANSLEYNVETITLLDLLDLYKAPKNIEYLSIDTEGSELEVIKNFDFEKYTFNCITIEHNYQTEVRDRIYDILLGQGYVRILEDFSGVDDWYLCARLWNKFENTLELI